MSGSEYKDRKKTSDTRTHGLTIARPKGVIERNMFTLQRIAGFLLPRFASHGTSREMSQLKNSTHKVPKITTAQQEITAYHCVIYNVDVLSIFREWLYSANYLLKTPTSRQSFHCSVVSICNLYPRRSVQLIWLHAWQKRRFFSVCQLIWTVEACSRFNGE